MKTIKISNLQEGDLFIYKNVMYEIVTQGQMGNLL